MDPIAIYETSHETARLQFELYRDSIRVAGTRDSIALDASLPLTQLNPHFERFWVHSVLFFVGILVILLAVVLLLVVVTIAEMQDRPVSLARPYTLIGTVAAVGFLLIIAKARKIEHVRFRNDAGIPILVIFRHRNDAGEFGQFVELLIERICKVRDEDPPAGFVPEDR